MFTPPTDTIAAVATPAGRGGLGVIRVSGNLTTHIAKQLLGTLPAPRHAHFAHFHASDGTVIDHGIALYFPAPHSYTGESVLELQAHGSPVVLDWLLKTVLQHGARLAQPGEFTERAFLNGKLDLAQAEAVADLIDSTSEQAARCALRSLQGVFSEQIHMLVNALIELRSYIEAGIDFVDEEIDLLADGQVQARIQALITQVETIQSQAQQGYLLKEGIHLVLVGAPNVGKSSLLNRLAERDTAIVTPIAGTTRDIVRDQIQLDGMPLHITDTAGLRETDDVVEQAGIQRTKQVLQDADVVMLLLDDTHPNDTPDTNLLSELPKPPLVVRNKIDLSQHTPGLQGENVLYISAKTGAGIAELKIHLRHLMGLSSNTEGTFMARRRHLDALQRAHTALDNSLVQAHAYQNELLAEELRLAQQALGEITGEFSADDLLGQIFATFCIGK